MKVSGIYEILNIKNGHCYIGSAVNVYHRWYEHKSLLKDNKHHSKHLQNAWNKYGEETFSFTLLEECKPDNLREKEQSYINTKKPIYNMNNSVSPWHPSREISEDDIKNALRLLSIFRGEAERTQNES